MTKNTLPSKKHYDKKLEIEIPQKLYDLIHYINVEKRKYIIDNKFYTESPNTEYYPLTTLIHTESILEITPMNDPEFIGLCTTNSPYYIPGIVYETDGKTNQLSYAIADRGTIQEWNLTFSELVASMIEKEKDTINTMTAEDIMDTLQKEMSKKEIEAFKKRYKNLLDDVQKKFVAKNEKKTLDKINNRCKIDSKIYKVPMMANWSISQDILNAQTESKVSIERATEEMKKGEFGNAFYIAQQSTSDTAKTMKVLKKLYKQIGHPYAVKNIESTRVFFEKEEAPANTEEYEEKNMKFNELYKKYSPLGMVVYLGAIPICTMIMLELQIISLETTPSPIVVTMIAIYALLGVFAENILHSIYMRLK